MNNINTRYLLHAIIWLQITETLLQLQNIDKTLQNTKRMRQWEFCHLADIS